MRQKAEVTVFFSLILCTVMAFVIIIAKHSLLSYIKIKAEAITDSSVKSGFSEYSKLLFDKYNILCVDTTYKGKTGGVELFERHVKEYMEESIAGDKARLFIGINEADCSLEKYMLLSDLNFKPFILQVCEYADKNLGEKKSLEHISNGEVYEGDVDIFMDEIKHQLITYFVSMNNYTLPSERMLKKGNYSNTVFNNEMKINGRKYKDYSRKKIVDDMSKYSLNKFSSYTQKKEQSYLNYENEYIICGHKNEYNNLFEIIEKILRIQLKVHGYEEYLDYKKNLYDNYEWENYDSFEDYLICETDLSDDSLPYVKSIDSVINILNNNKDERGYEYNDYLYYFLSNMSEEEIAARMLDIIEINMRYLENNQFRIDNLIEYVLVLTTFYTSDEKSYFKEYEYGYLSRE